MAEGITLSLLLEPRLVRRHANEMTCCTDLQTMCPNVQFFMVVSIQIYDIKQFTTILMDEPVASRLQECHHVPYL